MCCASIFYSTYRTLHKLSATITVISSSNIEQLLSLTINGFKFFKNGSQAKHSEKKENWVKKKDMKKFFNTPQTKSLDEKKGRSDDKTASEWIMDGGTSDHSGKIFYVREEKMYENEKKTVMPNQA